LIRSREVGGAVVGPGRAQLTAAMWAQSVVVGLVYGPDALQVPFAEDQHAVGDLGPGGEDEPFSVGVRAGTSGGIFSAWIPALARTASKEPVNCPACLIDAMIDRLVHHAEVIALKGDSYRLKDRDLGRVPHQPAED
jgi:IstB-like ATP binding protein